MQMLIAVFTTSGAKALASFVSQSRASLLAGVLGIEREAAARVVPERPFHARRSKNCRTCYGTFVPAAPHQLRCDPCRVRALLGEGERA